MKELTPELVDTLERLIDATETLTAKLADNTVPHITATLDREHELLQRLEAAEKRIAEAEQKAAEAEQKVADLSAAATSGRKTTSFPKHNLEATHLDAALSSLSVEQRLAVKAELLRAGALA